jgi:anion-transporting  ArsA/GET3 family ATPase
MSSLLKLTRDKAILVCVGAGGVGKTTVAAAIGLRGACEGRCTLVLTIDPARRLADSLGVGALGHDPRPVPEERLRAAGLIPRAPVHAMMLDSHRTFDDLVRRFAPDAEARARLLKNPIYQQIAGRLAGTQEYAAIAEVHRLHRLGLYDLIVVDTPPSVNALDFLDAPGRLADALDSPALQWFIRPTLSAGEFSLRMLGMGGAFVLRRLARIAGSAFLENVAHFLVEFNAMLGGFRRRADEVAALFRDPSLSFVVLSGPDAVSTTDAIALIRRLRGEAMAVGGVVVNRVRPPAAIVRGRLREDVRASGATADLSEAEILETVDAFGATQAEWSQVAQAAEVQIDRIRPVASPASVVRAPMVDGNVHDVKSLAVLAADLYREDS